MTSRNNILITGASSGIGQTLAKMYANQGRNLALCARRLEKLESLKADIAKSNPEVTVSIRELDVNDHDQVFEVFNAFADDLGRLDRVIVNAGVGKGAPLGTGNFAANQQTANTNFTGALAQCEAALELFRAQNYGHLVTMSSVSSVSGLGATATVYAATKAALTSLSEGMRINLYNTPIKVTTIQPGFIQSEMTEKLKGVPFIVSTEKGCEAIIKAIEKEGKSYFVPAWPWAIVARLLPLIPIKILAKGEKIEAGSTAHSKK